MVGWVLERGLAEWMYVLERGLVEWTYDLWTLDSEDNPGKEDP